MKTTASTKIRAIGGASVLALSAGLTGPAFAQTGPDPVLAAPTPTAPAVPGNAEECTVVSGTITCLPGNDADGFIDISDDPFGLDVQDGAVVTGPVIVTGPVTGDVDGSIQTSGDFDGGLAVGADSDVTIGDTGFIQTDGDFSVAVEAGANSTLTNNGTIYTTGDNFSDAVSLNEGATFTNNGLVQTDGDESFGVFGPADGLTVVNSETGSIITSGTASFGIAVLDGATVTNDGLIQTFGDNSVGIDIGISGDDQLVSTVTNNGSIVTAGTESIGIAVRDNDIVINNGLVSTAGDEAQGIVALIDATITNDGDIETAGFMANGIQTLSGATITNNGSITTTGDLANGVFVDADTVGNASTVTNNGTIEVSGDESIGILVLGDDAVITNGEDGTITTNGLAGFGIVALDGATITNAGTIETNEFFGIGIDAQEMASVTNSGTITTVGDFGIGIGVRSDSTVTNSGDVSTQGAEATGITTISNSTVVNSGNVTTEGDSAIGINTFDGGTITNSGIVSTTGDFGADAISVLEDSIVTNSGTISTEGADSFAIFARLDDSDGVSVTNSETGTISTVGDNSFAISLANDGTIDNSGTITTMGVDAFAIDALNGALVTNSGTISTGGDGSFAVSLLDNAALTNAAGGVIEAAGDDLVAVIVGFDSTVTNDGTISTAGELADGVILDDGSVLNNNADGIISTDGDDSFAVAFLGDGELNNAGLISTTGEDSDGVVFLGDATIDNSGMITAAGDARGIDVLGVATITNTGTIMSGESDAIRLAGDGSVVINSGLIQSDGDEGIDAEVEVGDDTVGINDLRVENSGTILADDKGITANENLTVINTGRIESITDEAVEANGAGLFLDNSGDIISPFDDAVDGDDQATIINTGLIQGGENDAIELNSGTITNSGTIESLSSDPGGDFSDMGLTNRELDAGIDFDGGGDDGDGLVTNLAGGVIIGDIGINASSGNFVDDGEGVAEAGSPANFGNQTIVNFGTISGRIVNPATGRIDAVLLSFGDDVFQQWQTGITNGVVDGEDGNDTLIFGNNSADDVTRDLADIEANFLNFEETQLLATGDGGFLLTGEGDVALSLVAGDVTLEGTLTDTFSVDGEGSLTITETGMIDVEDQDGIKVNVDDFTITNAGTIRSNEDEAIEASDRNGLTVTNSGLIIADENGDKGIEANENLTIVNSGRIESVTSEAIEADGAGLNLTNSGEIISPLDDAVDGNADVTIVNSGLIQGGENDGLELDSGVITNSGIIESLSSDPEGDFSDAGLTNRELDAGIDFDGVDDPDNLAGPATDTVTNLAGGIIRGDIGINASSGNFVDDGEGGSEVGSPANVRSQTIVNFGTITGNAVNPATGRTDAVLLSFGDDTFQQWQTGITNGTVDGEDGDDTLIFGNDSADNITRSLTNITDPLQYTGFETIAFLDMGGGITLVGEGDARFDILGGDITLDGAITDRLDIDGESTLTITENGSVILEDDTDAIRVNVDNVTITNSGAITSGDDAIDGQFDGGTDGLTVINTATGVITAVDKGIEGGTNLTVVNDGTITSTADEAIEIDGIGLDLTNNGSIISPFDDAVDGDDQATIVNTGLIQGGENDAIELNSGTITNSGTIESLSSDPEGDFSDMALTNRELDAGIDFDGGGDDGDGLVTNLAGGVIIGDIGINASSGNFVDDGEGGAVAGSPANFGDQTVVNFGTITGRIVNPATGRMDAVLLSFGDDEFQQWTGATVNGWVDLEAGDDTFILEGTASSITGGVQGGEGDDLAIIAGTLDADNIFGFETFQFGSALGGTLNDAVVSGARTVDGDAVFVGETAFNLGVDSLTATGSITLEDTSTLTIATPLDLALVGQTVVVLEDGTGFTDNGATINILDDDLLIEYTPVIGSLAVQVNLVDPLTTAGDPNVATFGAAFTAAANAGNLSDATFDLVNNLPDAGAFEALALDALPNLSDAEGREIFETSSAASEALNRHLASDGSGVWGQFIVRGAEQDLIAQSAAGYDSDQLIFTVGGDFMFGEHGRIGLLASYADIENSDFGANGGARGETEIESIKLGAYVATTFDQLFINGELAYLTGDIESSRTGVLGQIGSSYDFDGFAYSGTVGYDVLPDENVSLTPSVGFNGANISFDDASEIGGFGFAIDREDADFFELRGGIEFASEVSESVNGFIRGTFVYELNDDPRSLALNSSEIGSLVVFTPEIDAERFELSAAATIDVSDSFVIEVGYLGDYASGYDAHSARATARFRF